MSEPFPTTAPVPSPRRRALLSSACLGASLALHPAVRARASSAEAGGPTAPAVPAVPGAPPSGAEAAPAWAVPSRPLPRPQWVGLSAIDAVPIPPDRPWRPPGRTMRPRYVTVHSTANADPRADAAAHGRLMLRGLRSADPSSRTGFVSWHFTVDAVRVVQHLPVREQGDHADFHGRGNRESVGIELVTAAGMPPGEILHRAAFLVARLMRQHGIAASRVVPHQHWPRPPDGSRKACPAVLLDGAVPGARWHRFVGLAQAYRRGLDAHPALPPIA